MAETKKLEVFTDRTGRRWLNSSVVELMKKRAESHETPRDTIRRLARAMVADAKAEGWTEIPFDPEMLAELQGIEVRCASCDINAEARLMPLPDQRLEIEYAPEAPETRRRFSICHEIAHTFFPDYFTRIQHRRAVKKFDPVHAELEHLCHVGAGELLMPFDEFVQSVGRRQPSMTAADGLGKYFNASMEAALRRMVDLSENAHCLLWLSSRLKPTEERNAGPEFDLGFEKPKPKLRVDYQFASPSWKTFIPKHKSVPDQSSLYTVLGGEAYEKQQEDWSDLKIGEVFLEAVGSMHCQPQTGVMALVSSS